VSLAVGIRPDGANARRGQGLARLVTQVLVEPTRDLAVDVGVDAVDEEIGDGGADFLISDELGAGLGPGVGVEEVLPDPERERGDEQRDRCERDQRLHRGDGIR
jgi:hypothetical protein